jgi:sialate O-acetylesterase
MKNRIMKKILSSLIATVIVLVIASPLLHAEVKLPAIFGDNMVIQQLTEAAIWGKATANTTVKVTTSWNKKSYTARADKDGRWKMKVSTPIAGGPFTITISDGKTLTLNNVMIGEVWICSGQSNMVMPMKGYRNQPIIGSNEIIATSSGNNIRIFTVTRAASLVPLDDFEGSWKTSEPENVSEFSATAYYFGLMLNRALKVPVGLINTSWGGTRIEPWISEVGFKKFDWVKLPDKTPQKGTLSPQTPTVLFNAMINPVAGYGIRGAIWYQGENNRNEPVQYQQLLPGLVENWRFVWAIGDFPFYYAQIAPFDYGPAGLSSAYLREAQLKASKAIPNIGMACLMDAGEIDNIHPSNKLAAGNRLAYLALVKTYGKTGFACEGPVLKEMKVDGNQVKLKFDNAVNGLTSFGKELSCFEIAGANKRFYPAKAFITNTGITLYTPSVTGPVNVRYAFKDFVVGDLFNTEGLPASSFRTDTLDIQ